MKAILISPPYWVLLQDQLGSPGAYEPLGLEYVAASVRSFGFDCQVYGNTVIDPRKIATDVIEDQYNVVGISAATPAVPWALRVAAEVKNLSATTLVVLGGDHASACPEIVLEEGVDFAVVGEGEEAFSGLLQCLAEEREPHDVPGLVWLDDKGAVIQNPRARVERPDSLPWPSRSREILEHCRLYGLAYPAPSLQQSAAQILFSRGCPRQCYFCACSNVFGRGIRYRAAQDVVKEMEYLKEKYKVSLLYFSDLSFGAVSHKIHELCGLIYKSGLNIPWYVSATTTDIDPTMAEAMASAGCFKVAIGVESMHPETHAHLRPWSSVEAVEKTTHMIDRAGMLVRGYYMIGVPGETADKFREGIERLCTIPVDEVRFAFFTPFPGTGVYEKYAHLSLAKDLSDLGSAKPVLNFPAFSADEQRECCEWAIRRFYCGPEYAQRWREKVRRFPQYDQSFAEFHAFLGERGIEVE